MRVRCKLCEFESNGRCLKKRRNGSPISVKINKPRNCDLYSEDALKVLGQFRKSEAHKAEMKRQELRRAKFKATMEQLKRQAAEQFVAEANANLDRLETKSDND